jgi:hypothetical protein
MTVWLRSANLKIMLFLNHNNFASIILNPRFGKARAVHNAIGQKFDATTVLSTESISH